MSLLKGNHESCLARSGDAQKQCKCGSRMVQGEEWRNFRVWNEFRKDTGLMEYGTCRIFGNRAD